MNAPSLVCFGCVYARGLRHDNLVEIYGYWIDGSEDLWMVMEYLPAGDLRVALPKVSPIRVMQA